MYMYTHTHMYTLSHTHTHTHTRVERFVDSREILPQPRVNTAS